MFDHYMAFFRGELPTGEDIIFQEDTVKLKRCIYSAQVRTPAGVITSAGDSIIINQFGVRCFHDLNQHVKLIMVK